MKSCIKKAVSLLLVLIFLLSLLACGETPVDTSSGSMSDTSTGSGGGSGLTEDPETGETEYEFNVTVLKDGNKFRPKIDIDIYWTNLDNGSIHTAKLEKSGTAGVNGLDGDYRVTLSAVPEGLAYDPNGYTVTNDNKNVTINLYTVSRITGSGTGLYDSFEFSKPGVYSCVIEDAKDRVYFEFSPQSKGTYTIESWVDVKAEEINPFCDVYNGTSSFKNFDKTIEDGGACGSYTTNFVHEIGIADEQISTGGSQAYSFAIGADVKSEIYPVTIIFAVKKDGEVFELPHNVYEMAVPTYDFSQYVLSEHQYDPSLYDKEGLEILYKNKPGAYVYDESTTALWKREDGGDDFYHLYDEEKYASTNGYGPIIYAYISMPCDFIDTAFNMVEYHGNKNLTVNGVNYKHLIEGYSALATRNEANFNGGSYYCSEYCQCHLGQSTGLACTDECTDCHKDCYRIREELIYVKGYAEYCNSDGAFPVTQDLKDFLFGYGSNGLMFRDGDGIVEVAGIGASDESVWMFACFYYKAK